MATYIATRISIPCAALLLAACGEERGLLITLEESGVSDQIDEIELMMVATRTAATNEDAETCRAATRTVPDDRIPELTFPFDWSIETGNGAWRCIAVRVVGKLDDIERIRTEEIYCPDPESVTHEHLLLHEGCLDQLCLDGSICVFDGERWGCDAERTGTGNIFDQMPTVDQQCDGTELGN